MRPFSRTELDFDLLKQPDHGSGSPTLQRRGGWPHDVVGEAADETLEALRCLWSGASEYAGKHVTVGGSLPVLPANPAGVPIWVGGAIRRSAVRAARLGDGWYAGINFRLSRLPRQTETHRTTSGDRGRAVAINRLTLADHLSAGALRGHRHQPCLRPFEHG